MTTHQTFLWNDVGFYQPGCSATDEPSLWDVIMRMFKMFGLRQFTKLPYGTMLAFTNLTATDEPSLWDAGSRQIGLENFTIDSHPHLRPVRTFGW